MGINRRTHKKPRLTKRFVQIPRDQESRIFEIADQIGSHGSMGKGLRRRGNAKFGNQFLFSCLQYRGNVITKKQAEIMSNEESAYVVSVSTHEGMDQTFLLCEPVANPRSFMRKNGTPRIVGVASTNRGPGLAPVPPNIAREIIYIDGRPSINPFASRINGNRWNIEDRVISDIADMRTPQRSLKSLSELAHNTSSYGNCELVAAIAEDSKSMYRIVGCFVYIRGNLTDEFVITGADPRVDSHHFRTPGPGAWLSMDYMSTSTDLTAGVISYDRPTLSADLLTWRHYQELIDRVVEAVFRVQLPYNTLPQPSRSRSVKSPYRLSNCNFALIASDRPVTLTSSGVDKLVGALGVIGKCSPYAICMFVVSAREQTHVQKWMRLNGFDVVVEEHATNKELGQVVARRKWLYDQN